MSTVPRNHHQRRLRQDVELRKNVGQIYNGFLGEIHDRLLASHERCDSVHDIMEELFLALYNHRQHCTPSEWTSFVEMCRRHPLCDLVHQDPFTYRAFIKPRGYAGDAELMDYIYGREEIWPAPPSTPLGASIFDFTTAAPASEGVRARRGFIADLLDNLVAEKPGLRVLSVAAGHLREAGLASAVRRRRLERFVALDADAASLEQVRNSYGCFGIETVLSRVTRLVDSRVDLGDFDLIYSLGLFDYLPQRLGRRIVARFFDMVAPGGRVVVANFLPSIRDVGYMEAFMDWQLIYRTRQEMIDLTAEIPEAAIKNIQLFAEENHNIIFTMVTKA